MTSPPLTEKWVPLWPTHSQYQLGDELGYAEITANVTISATTEATANTIVTAPALTFDGATPVIIEFCSGYINVGSALSVWLYQDGVSIGRIGLFIAGGQAHPCVMRVRMTPSAGAHTYSIRAFQSGGNSTINANPLVAGNGPPTFIRVSRVNAVPPTVLPGPITPVTYGTSLPVGPADGQEAILVDSLTAPTYAWHFRYVASITDVYKWVFIGGAPWVSNVPGVESTASGTYVDLTTPQVFTAPRAGVFIASASYSQEYGASASGNGAGCQLLWNAVQVMEVLTMQQAGASLSQSGFGTYKGTLAAAQEARLKWRAVNSAANYLGRTLSVEPVRVA